MSKKFLSSEGLITLWAQILAKLAGKADSNHTHSNYANQNAFSNVKVGSTTVAADSTQDTLEIAAGTGVTVTGDATNDKVTIGLGTSGATAGTYKSVTVDAYGRVTAGTNPTTLSGYGITDAKIANGVITLGTSTITPITELKNVFGKVKAGSVTVEADTTQDTLEIAAGTGVTVTGDASNDKVTIGLGTSGAAAGTYKSVTVDTYGRVTAGTNPNTLSGYGITDAKIANGVITLGTNTITPITQTTMNTAISNAVSNAIASVYQFRGVVSFTDLPAPDQGRVGDVYSVKDGFIMDENFLEFDSDNPNEKVGAGTDVVIVDTDEGRKYNIMYKEDINVLTEDEIREICQ